MVTEGCQHSLFHVPSKGLPPEATVLTCLSYEELSFAIEALRDTDVEP